MGWSVRRIVMVSVLAVICAARVGAGQPESGESPNWVPEMSFSYADPVTGERVECGESCRRFTVPAGVELDDTDDDSPQRLADLEAEAARLKSEAEQAMQGPSFYESTKERDDLMRKRDLLLAERQEIVIADYIAGMTDRFAEKVYEEFR